MPGRSPLPGPRGSTSPSALHTGLSSSLRYVGAGGQTKIGWNPSEDQHGHFGALFESDGRGKLRPVNFTEPHDDDEGLYERVRRQLLDGLTVWLRNGWLEEQDLHGVITASKSPTAPNAPTPRPRTRQRRATP